MIVDSNVVIDILDDASPDATVLLDYLALRVASTGAQINLVVFAEVSSRFKSVEAADRRIASLGLTIAPLDHFVAFRAGHAFADYRRNGGERTSILPDFLIGAHAEILGVPIMTRDKRRFATYFPSVALIDPRTLDA